MTPTERAAWCIAQAEEIERDLPPQEDPHIWDAPRMAARTWRYLAERVLVGNAAAGEG